MREVYLAEAILAIHVLIIVFNVAGLILIPIGAWLGWRIVRIAWLRLLHLALLAVVAGQALAGRACILTTWQSNLTGDGLSPPPLIMHSVNTIIYWNLPLWFFTILYSTVFLYILALSFLIPFGRRYSRSVRSLRTEGISGRKQTVRFQEDGTKNRHFRRGRCAGSLRPKSAGKAAGRMPRSGRLIR